ncbi:MAG: hypothetical protein NTY66_00245 [Candidatus Vogelbacteria bacterium]|nr:hypothetical protein [Candidatus Vogelbacteria bacterium]
MNEEKKVPSWKKVYGDTYKIERASRDNQDLAIQAILRELDSTVAPGEKGYYPKSIDTSDPDGGIRVTFARQS